MNNELIGIISNEGELKGVIEDNSFNVIVQITESGPRGLQGSDGYTPIKGIDYFDGKDGKDGYTPIKGIDYFDGDKGDTGSQGENGTDGKDGESGVVIGTTLPTDPEVKVFIDVSGDPDPLATEQYVDDAISLALNSIINGNEVYY